MDGMISAKQYAQEKGVTVKTVHRWCARGDLSGVVKAQTAVGSKVYQYWIPPDAERPTRKQKYKKRGEQEGLEEHEKKPTPVPKMATMREKAEHIRRYCISRSFKRLMEETGLNHMEIRRIYDRLHEVYSI